MPVLIYTCGITALKPIKLRSQELEEKAFFPLASHLLYLLNEESLDKKENNANMDASDCAALRLSCLPPAESVQKENT